MTDLTDSERFADSQAALGRDQMFTFLRSTTTTRVDTERDGDTEVRTEHRARFAVRDNALEPLAARDRHPDRRFAPNWLEASWENGVLRSVTISGGRILKSGETSTVTIDRKGWHAGYVNKLDRADLPEAVAKRLTDYETAVAVASSHPAPGVHPMTDAYITDRHHLEVVPDGTVISWLRIPGDPTSEAVAFVRREVETVHDDDTERPVTRSVVWISPGGWDPQTIESAGVTFPCHVIRWGDVSSTVITASEAPAAVETLFAGGTYPRDHALECAARAWAGMSAISNRDRTILETAEKFEEWLRRPEPPKLKGMIEVPIPDTYGENDTCPTCGRDQL